MPRQKKVDVPENITPTATENNESVVVETPVVEKTSVDIMRGEDLVRTYSLEVHGENFRELAQSFIEGHPDCQIV